MHGIYGFLSPSKNGHLQEVHDERSEDSAKVSTCVLGEGGCLERGGVARDGMNKWEGFLEDGCIYANIICLRDDCI